MSAPSHLVFDENEDFVPLEKKAAQSKTANQDSHHKEKKKKSKKTPDGPLKRRSLFVTGLPEDTTNEMLEAAFGEIGPLRSCFVVCEKGEERLCKGFGFVTYSLNADAERAIQHFRNAKFMGKRLVVDYSKPRDRAAQNTEDGIEKGDKSDKSEKPKRTRTPKELNPKKWRLIVRNLGWKVNAKNLEEAFREYGTVSEATLVKDLQGRSRGFGFVQLDSKEAANRAMQKLNGKEIGGRAVAVDWALSKSKFLEAGGKKKEEKKEAGDADDDENEAAEEEGDDNNEGKDDEQEQEQEEQKEEPNEEEPDEDDEEEKRSSKQFKSLPKKSDVTEGRTLFVRNLLFSATAKEVQERFAEFGEIDYCVLVCDPSTGLSRGSAFVQFKDKAAVERAMREAYPYGRKQEAGGAGKDKKKRGSGGVLEDLSELYVQGRPVKIDIAVERGAAVELKEQRVKQKDRRNLYLLNEGVIEEGTSAARGVSKSDMQKRQQGITAAKQKLVNPNFYVSTTRLAVRNIPKAFDEKQLRQLFLEAANSNPGDRRARIVQVKIAKDDERRTEEGEAKSRGFGFVEFTEHAHALQALRKLNNNAEVWSANARPIVTFAVENRIELKKREERLAKTKSAPYEKRERPNNGSGWAKIDATKKKQTEDSGARKRKAGQREGEEEQETTKRKTSKAVTKKKTDDGEDRKKKQKKTPKEDNKSAPKRVRRDTDSLNAVLQGAEEASVKKHRAGKTKRQQKAEDKFDDLVERYKQRVLGVKLGE